MSRARTALVLALGWALASTGWAAPANTPHMDAGKLRNYYIDQDRDGVVDILDECPNTPPGRKVDLIGCELDSDRDGVPDSEDMCPDSPKSEHINFLGCVPDTDRDGVPDHIDRCPETPLGTEVNAYGCTPQEKVILHLTFATGEYRLLPDHRRQIEAAFAHLKNLDPDSVILVEGFTDAIGCQDDNLKLSWNRAEAVRTYLVSNKLVPAARVFVLGRGEAMPIDDNLTAAGRAKNRRIELTVLPKTRLPAEAQPMIPEAMKGYVRRPGRCPLPDER